jgi:S-DNA-T family DNA segregation ATPase FtsK/SpoIIIE
MPANKRKAADRSIVTEAVAFALLAIGLLTALALLTYDPLDPAANVAGRAEAFNLVGRAGAWLADLMFQLAGLFAFIIPAALLVLAVRSFKTGELRVPAGAATGLGIVALALAGLTSIFPKLGIVCLANTRATGGLVGFLVAMVTTSMLNTVGASVVLAVVALVTAMLTMHFSVKSTVRKAFSHRTRPVGIRKWLSIERAREKFRAWLAYRRATRQQRAAEAAARRAEDGERQLAEQQERRTAEERVREELLETSGRPVTRVAPAERVDEDSESTPPTARVPRTDRLTVTTTARSTPAPAGAKIAQDNGRRLAVSGPDRPDLDPEIVEMVSTASIVRKETPRPQPLPFASTGEAGWNLPPTTLLTAPPPVGEQGERELEERAILLAERCKEFAVTGHIHRINPGPVVTTFEFKPDPGIKYSRVVGLADDLCLALKAESIRIDRIPGKSTVGIEVPNANRTTIYLRDIVESPEFQRSASRLTLGLGKTIDGRDFIADLQRMPHLLIAGSTGSGKSVMVNAIVTSILFKSSPAEVKFIMVDPKRLELGLYEGIPHLLTPIVVDPKRAANALKWAVTEMENRYRTLAGLGVRNIEQYNRDVKDLGATSGHEGEFPQPLPYIVILIDELADLMMVASSEVEASITRLAQMARAVGIHLVLATQRPSVDVITGLIKANFPSRISFRVSSKVDSRTIIDANGAEQLLGQGDMLFLPPGSSRLVRVHGSFVSEADVKAVTAFVKEQDSPTYDETVTLSAAEVEDVGGGARDDLFEDALKIVCDMGRASTSVLQRRLRIGYGRAAAILDQMEQAGFVGAPDGSRPRPVLSAAYEFRERNEQMLEEREGERDG